jgi:hypothetical protein
VSGDQTSRLDEATVRAIALAGAGRICAACDHLAFAGWESVGAGVDRSSLMLSGALWLPGDDEPSCEEWHPEGTRFWAPKAPIALRWFPYNRCEVWQCRSCARGFLRYVEYGGYYVDERMRLLDPALITA